MRIPGFNAAEVIQAFRDVAKLLAPLEETSAFDWKGRRLTHLGAGTDESDAATVGQLTAALEGRRGTAPPPRTPTRLQGGRVRIGPYATRGAPVEHESEMFIANDLQNVMWISDGTAWHYLQGIFRGTLSPDLKPAVLGASDTGFPFFATDFNRSYTWSGSAWDDSPDSPSRAQLVHFDNPPIPAAGWQLCNGSSVNRSTNTGGVTGVTIPDLIGAGAGPQRFLRGAGGSGATGGNATGHTHPVNPPNTTSTGPSTNTSGSASPGTSGNDDSEEVESGSGTTVAADNHHHAVDSHTHDLGDHTHDVDVADFTSGTPSGSGGDDALPPWYNARIYYRL